MTFSFWFGGRNKDGNKAPDTTIKPAGRDEAHQSSADNDITPRPVDSRILRLKQGSEDAFASIFREYATGLLTFAWRKIGSRPIAEEIVQDVFLDIWERRETLAPDMVIRAYLYSAVRYRVLNQYRSTEVERRFEERMTTESGVTDTAITFESSDALLNVSELRSALIAAMRQIPPRSREVFVLNREHHMSYAEIAKMLGISIKTVEVHMGKALAILRTALREWKE